MAYSKVKSGERLQFPAAMFNDLVDLVGTEAGFGSDKPLTAQAQGVIVPVKNISGSDRLRFDCMALGATRWTIGDDGKETVVFDVDTADPAETPAILQTPIADGKFGRALIFGYTLAKLEQASSATDLLATPNASGHNLEPGTTGTIQILAAPSTSADCVRPVLIGGATAAENDQTAIIKVTTAIAARSGATVSSQTCDRFTLVGTTLTDSGENLEVFNLWHLEIPADIYLTAVKIGEDWIAETPGLAGIRLSGSTLQHSIDGATWTTWHTGTTC